MQKAYQTMKPKSCQTFKFDDLLKELDDEGSGRVIHKKEFLNNGGNDYATEKAQTQQGQNGNEFDFNKHEKGRQTKSPVKSEIKRDSSARKVISSKREVDKKGHTVEFRTKTTEINSKIKVDQIDNKLETRIKNQVKTNYATNPLKNKKQPQSSRNPLPIKEVQETPSTTLNIYPKRLPISSISEPGHFLKDSEPDYIYDYDSLKNPTNYNAQALSKDASNMFGFTSSYQTNLPKTVSLKEEPPKKLTPKDWEDMYFSNSQQGLPNLVNLISKATRKKSKDGSHHSEEQPHIQEARVPTLSVYERNKEFLERKQKRLKQIERETSASFRPKINKNSKHIDQIRNSERYVPRFETLHKLDAEIKQREQDLKEIVQYERYEKFQKEEDANCTFTPKINSSYTIGNSEPKLSISERNKLWIEKKKEKIQSMAVVAKQDEVKGCTFKPKLYTKSPLRFDSRF
jgi:hypothetical protein